ncbi:unnamed protein product [Rotaria magnacalcarata]|uniref:Uncharacterized protein n=1 Tax=Rotaria magnacalcarata TaxID=392030 RepID=A0A816YQI0_9BILA|nr:unnamed protein product [Rotaria magnacalcarata]CAF2165331.1 unnamed protein product [Rotaria magnacalcarata]CAF3725028.1 unnamed protein product [Rotaria magnacalcarata]CAF3786388.1 unnamed protein product [Rotaria magnacalcarata]
MGELNITFSDRKHQITFLTSKPVADHTGLYIILLLSSLLFILVFYLLYNFISFKRYSCSQENKRKDSIHSTELLNDRLSIVLTQPAQSQIKTRAHSYEELISSTHQMPLRTASSLSIYPNFMQTTKSFIPNQYEISKRLVSDL